MVLSRPQSVNANIRWVGAVIMGWHKFQFVLVLINNDVLQLLGTFIVHIVDGWVKSLFFPSSQKSLGRL